MSSATPTPSPRPNWLDAQQTPRRPATRAAHTRVNSYSTQSTFSPRPPRDSPRYNSSGEYATVDGVPYYNDAVYSRDPSYEAPPRPIAQARPPTSLSHARRASASVPQRPSTVRPTTHAAPRVVKPPSPPKATEEHAARHKIPPGYSLKNWDPREEPILLLGSVFDANSLGKWIYDWTVYKVGSREPLAEMAGDLWLLLLELTEKTNRAINVGLKVRNKEKRALVEDFLDSSERLMDMLRLLLKNCEAPMLKAAKKKQSGLGKNSGIEFVDTLFGRDRELIRTEKFMTKLRTWNMRFEANVAPILDNPTA